MSLFPLTRRKTAVNVLPRFPARVDGGTGVGITKANGVYTFALDFDTLIPATSIDDPNTTWVPVWDEAVGAYTRISAAALASDSAVASIFGRTGSVVAESGDYDADQVDYDNGASGLSATDVQAAIDELAAGAGGGSGDMLASTYDPNNVVADAFDMDNMVEGSTNLILTASERSAIAGLASTYQPLDSDLTAFAGLNIAADTLPYGTGSHTLSLTDLTSFARTLLDDTDASTMRGTLGLVIGTNVQAYDADLTTWAGLTPSANFQTLVPHTFAQMRADLDLEAGTDFYSIAAADAAFQPKDSDLTIIAGLTATTDSFLQAKSSAWTTRTPTQVTEDLIDFVGDGGSGGAKGLVPAPASGDANKFLKGNGTWGTPAGGGGGISAVVDDTAPQLGGDLDLNSHGITGTGDINITGTVTASGNAVWTAGDFDIADYLTSAAAGSTYQPLDSDLTTWAGLTPSANAQSLVTAADYAAMRALLDLEAGTDFYSKSGADAAFQPLDSDLTAFAGLSIAADKLPYGTGSHTLGLTDFTSFARTILDDADAATVRATIGAGTGSGDVAGQSSSVDGELALFSGTGGKTIKRATTTGLLRASSGVLAQAIAGTDYYNPGGTDVAVADGGTGASSAPAARTNLGLVIGTDVQAYLASLPSVALAIIIDGVGSTITTGIKGDLRIPFNATITKWSILGDQSGSIVIDVWKDTYANYPPAVGDSITASAKPTVSSATKNESSTLTGWTTSISAGDTLRFNVDSITSFTRVVLTVEVIKT